AEVIPSIRRENVRESDRIRSSRRSSPGGGTKPKRDSLVAGPSCESDALIARSTSVQVFPPRTLGSRPPTMMLILGSDATRTASSWRSCCACVWTLWYVAARFWSVPSDSAREFDWPRTRRPRTATATRSAAMPTKATSSFVRTVTGRRPTARTSGLSAPPPSTARDASGGPPSASDLGISGRSGPEFRCRRGEARDQPFAVDSLDVLIGAHDQDHLAGLHVDVVTLEVESPLVAAHRRADLERRRVRDPVVPGLERASLVCPEGPDLCFAS